LTFASSARITIERRIEQSRRAGVVDDGGPQLFFSSNTRVPRDDWQSPSSIDGLE
jgi:hypothetical protein